jgi:hypothetical protein
VVHATNGGYDQRERNRAKEGEDEGQFHRWLRALRCTSRADFVRDELTVLVGYRPALAPVWRRTTTEAYRIREWRQAAPRTLRSIAARLMRALKPQRGFLG